VTANVAPADSGRYACGVGAAILAVAMEINERLMPLHEALFCETSPGPVKFAASLLGRCLPDVRLPLVEISDASKARVRDAMIQAGILN
jgi:4-hydroxy-tetrahydrodipicolinate synthase